VSASVLLFIFSFSGDWPGPAAALCGRSTGRPPTGAEPLAPPDPAAAPIGQCRADRNAHSGGSFLGCFWPLRSLHFFPRCSPSLFLFPGRSYFFFFFLFSVLMIIVWTSDRRGAAAGKP